MKSVLVLAARPSIVALVATSAPSVTNAGSLRAPSDRLHVWDTDRGRVSWSSPSFESATSVTFTRDGSWLVYQSLVPPSTAAVRARHLPSGREVVLPDAERPTLGARDTTVAAVTRAGGVALLDLSTGRHREVIGPQGVRVRQAIIAPDGSRVATLFVDGSVKVWETAEGRQVAELRDDGTSGVRREWLLPGPQLSGGPEYHLAYSTTGNQIILTTKMNTPQGERIRTTTWNGTPRRENDAAGSR